jgi:hypothetical protein
MKFFRVIFAFYLLLLSAQPCRDFAADDFCSLQSENEQTQMRNDRGDSGSESGECSPFCICSCRQASELSLTEAVAVSTRSTRQFSCRSHYSHQPLSFIWQPPKSSFTA